MFGFGYKLLLSGLLDTLYKNIYYVVIGRCYSPAQLGQYSRAEQFNMIFSSNLTSIVQRVSYPVLSSIQEEPERLREAYRQIIKTTMLVTFACMLGLAAVAKPLIIILIGEKWLPAVSFLQIICFSGMLYQNEIFQPVKLGMKLKAYIKQVREDGKIDLELQPYGAKKVDDFSETLLQYIKEKGGHISLNDKTDAGVIYETFGVSKKTFKKAVGDLYKKRLIVLEDTGIRLA